jgi:hypothetical protein
MEEIGRRSSYGVAGQSFHRCQLTLLPYDPRTRPIAMSAQGRLDGRSSKQTPPCCIATRCRAQRLRPAAGQQRSPAQQPCKPAKLRRRACLLWMGSAVAARSQRRRIGEAGRYAEPGRDPGIGCHCLAAWPYPGNVQVKENNARIVGAVCCALASRRRE